jgi:hypothetical protein
MTTQLSAQDQTLINTNFGEEIEKIASAYAAEIQDAYSYGFSKLAEEAANAKDEEDKKEDKEEDKKEKMDEESEKKAAELGAFIERGFFDGLRKLGSERHGDEMFYLEPFITEKVALSMGVQAATKAKRALQGMKELSRPGTIAQNARAAVAGPIAPSTRAKAVGAAALGASPYLAGAAGLGLAGKAMFGHKDQQ